MMSHENGVAVASHSTDSVTQDASETQLKVVDGDGDELRSCQMEINVMEMHRRSCERHVLCTQPTQEGGAYKLVERFAFDICRRASKPASAPAQGNRAEPLSHTSSRFTLFDSHQILHPSRKGTRLNDPVQFGARMGEPRSEIERAALLPRIGCSQASFVARKKLAHEAQCSTKGKFDAIPSSSEAVHGVREATSSHRNSSPSARSAVNFLFPVDNENSKATGEKQYNECGKMSTFPGERKQFQELHMGKMKDHDEDSGMFLHSFISDPTWRVPQTSCTSLPDPNELPATHPSTATTNTYASSKDSQISSARGWVFMASTPEPSEWIRSAGLYSESSKKYDATAREPTTSDVKTPMAMAALGQKDALFDTHTTMLAPSTRPRKHYTGDGCTLTGPNTFVQISKPAPPAQDTQSSVHQSLSLDVLRVLEAPSRKELATSSIRPQEEPVKSVLNDAVDVKLPAKDAQSSTGALLETLTPPLKLPLQPAKRIAYESDSDMDTDLAPIADFDLTDESTVATDTDVSYLEDLTLSDEFQHEMPPPKRRSFFARLFSWAKCRQRETRRKSAAPASTDVLPYRISSNASQQRWTPKRRSSSQESRPVPSGDQSSVSLRDKSSRETWPDRGN